MHEVEGVVCACVECRVWECMRGCGMMLGMVEQSLQMYIHTWFASEFINWNKKQ